MGYSRQRGTAGYENSGDWTWEHWPPPFDQWAPSDSVAQPAPILGRGGMGCSSCGGGSGGPESAGLGQTGTGLFGTGLFAGGPSTWGWGEYVTIAGVGYVGISLYQDITSDTLKKGYRKSKRAASSAASGIGSIVKYALIAAGAFGAYYLYEQYQSGGLGDYQPQGWATPQVLTDPTNGSQLLIPAGY